MPETPVSSGLHNRIPEELRKELMDIAIANRPLFTATEYINTLNALIQMKPTQYEGFKKRIQDLISFRTENNITNAETLRP